MIARWQRWWRGRLFRLAIGVLGTLLLFFPRLDLAVKQLGRLGDWDALIEPNHPALAAINAEIDAKLPPGTTGRAEMQAVQRWVYENVKYRYDWVRWGNLDYWPTVSEVLETREEDCDGRAVLAASLLRARGFSTAHLEGNFSHVWVALGANDPRTRETVPLAMMSPIGKPAFSRGGGSLTVNLPDWNGFRPMFMDMTRFPVVRIFALAALWLLVTGGAGLTGSVFAGGAALVAVGVGVWQSWAARAGFNGAGASDWELALAGLAAVAGFWWVGRRRKTAAAA